MQLFATLPLALGTLDSSRGELRAGKYDLLYYLLIDLIENQRDGLLMRILLSAGSIVMILILSS